MKIKLWDRRNKRMSEPFSLNDIHTNRESNIVGIGWEDVYSFEDFDIRLFSDFESSDGVEIYAGDIVDLDSQGRVIMTLPFAELHEACMELEIGEIVGNIYE